VALVALQPTHSPRSICLQPYNLSSAS